MLAKTKESGFNLVELMIVVAIMGILLSFGVPAFKDVIAGVYVRNQAESLLAGIQTARTEAIKRNTVVRFQTVSDLTGGCAVSGTGSDWAVSLAGVSGLCSVDANPSADLVDGTVDPVFIQKTAMANNGRFVTTSSPTNPVICFSGLGQMTSPTSSGCTAQTVKITIQPPTTASSTVKALQVCVAFPGGQYKMCDPDPNGLLPSNDPRRCVCDPNSASGSRACTTAQVNQC